MVKTQYKIYNFILMSTLIITAIILPVIMFVENIGMIPLLCILTGSLYQDKFHNKVDGNRILFKIKRIYCIFLAMIVGITIFTLIWEGEFRFSWLITFWGWVLGAKYYKNLYANLEGINTNSIRETSSDKEKNYHKDNQNINLSVKSALETDYYNNIFANTKDINEKEALEDISNEEKCYNKQWKENDACVKKKWIPSKFDIGTSFWGIIFVIILALAVIFICCFHGNSVILFTIALLCPLFMVLMVPVICIVYNRQMYLVRSYIYI